MLRFALISLIWLLSSLVVAQVRVTALRTIGHPDNVLGIAITPDGKALAGVAGNKTLYIWETSTGQMLATRRLRADGMGVSISPDGKKAAVTTKETPQSGSIQVFDIEAGWSLYDEVSYGDEPANSDVLGTGLIKFSSDNKGIASQLSGWGPVTIWNLNSRRTVTVENPKRDVARDGMGASDFAFSPDENKLYVSWIDHGIQVLDTSNGHTTDLGGLKCNSLACSPNDRWLALGGGKTIAIVNRPLLERNKRRSGFYLDGHTDHVRVLAFSPDGRSLYSGSRDGTVRVWDLNTEQCSKVLHGHDGTVLKLSQSSDGKTLVSSALVVRDADLRGELRIWSLDGAEPGDVREQEVPHKAGVAAFHNGYYLRAIEHFTKCITTQEGTVLGEAYRNRGRCFEKRHDREAAIRDYRQSIRLNPKNCKALISLGRLYRNMHSYEEALRQFEKAIELDPDNVAALNGFAWLLATAIEEEHRDSAQAVKYAMHACELTDNKDPSCRNTLAAAFAEAGEFAAARLAQKSAIAALPEDTSPLRYDDYQRRFNLYERKDAYRDYLGDFDFDFNG